MSGLSGVWTDARATIPAIVALGHFLGWAVRVLRRISRSCPVSVPALSLADLRRRRSIGRTGIFDRTGRTAFAKGDRLIYSPFHLFPGAGASLAAATRIP